MCNIRSGLLIFVFLSILQVHRAYRTTPVPTMRTWRYTSPAATIHRTSCSSEQFQCKSSGRCVSLSWACDGYYDCADNSDEDEEYCRNSECPPSWVRCESSGRCIMRTWVCDGGRDCSDGADERNCYTSSSTGEDTSPAPAVTTTFVDISPKRTPPIFNCSADQFVCESNGKCVMSWSVCDGRADCPDHTDEDPVFCRSRVCPPNNFRCEFNGRCIPKSWVCDGGAACPDGADEMLNCYEFFKSEMGSAQPVLSPDTAGISTPIPIEYRYNTTKREKSQEKDKTETTPDATMRTWGYTSPAANK